MNREIKFRAYKKSTKEILPSIYLKKMITQKTRLTNDEYNDLIIMQYTWIKDKNWVEIYEWDIVKVEWYETDLKVVFDQKSCCFDYQYNDDWDVYWVEECFADISAKWEVVWNIHES